MAPLPLVGAAVALLVGCRSSGPTTLLSPQRVALTVQTPLLERYVESWHVPAPADALRGMRLVADAPVPTERASAVTRAIVRSNPLLAPSDALVLATRAVAVADASGVDFGFFCATLLQESGFSPNALSSAGAVGIAQFTIGTADAYGIDPFDWREAMGGAAALLASYVRAYRSHYADPYAAALAAYNAGPGAVARYHGIPPYPETREYVADVFLRWSRIAIDAGGPDGPRRRRAAGRPSPRG